MTENNDNLIKLRALVEELDTQETDTNEYNEILNEIESIIKEERKIISRLKKPDTKLKHYETICASILSVISATKL
jgi:hypothetical protein